MVDYGKIVKFIILLALIEYTIWAFILGDINFFNTIIPIRLLIAFIFISSGGILFGILHTEFNFWIKKSHNEKISDIKKYTGELKEEIELINEAFDLEKKIEAFKKRNIS